MRIEHVALWTDDLERLRAFYVDVLGAVPGQVRQPGARASSRTSWAWGRGRASS